MVGERCGGVPAKKELLVGVCGPELALTPLSDLGHDQPPIATTKPLAATLFASYLLAGLPTDMTLVAIELSLPFHMMEACVPHAAARAKCTSNWCSHVALHVCPTY